MPLWNSLALATVVNDTDELILFDGSVFLRATRAQLRQQLGENIEAAAEPGAGVSSPVVRLVGYDGAAAPQTYELQYVYTVGISYLELRWAGHNSTLRFYDNGLVELNSGLGVIDLKGALTNSGANSVFIRPNGYSGPALRIAQLAGQTLPSQTWEDDSGNVLAAVLAGGALRLPHLADAAAPNDSDYFSTDLSARAYKDSGGAVHALY